MVGVDIVGFLVGSTEGEVDGFGVGSLAVGFDVGISEGSSVVGFLEGLAVGLEVSGD